MNAIDNEKLDSLFQALNGQIAVHGGYPIGLVVCGGTALAALRLVVRTTKDVDVLCEIREERDGTMKLTEMIELPQWLADATAVVGRDFQLPRRWFNTGPAMQLQLGLPEGFLQRLVRKSYGDNLSLYFIGRIDQIHFKLYAAVDNKNPYSGNRHLEDLRKLRPTPEEIELAAHWTLTQDPSDEFRMTLCGLLREEGYGAVAGRI